MIKPSIKPIFLLMMGLILTACSPIKKETKDVDLPPLPLEQAIQRSSQHIMEAVRKKRILREIFRDSNIVVSPFLDLKTLQEMQVTKLITKAFTTTSGSTVGINKQIRIKPLTIGNIKNSQYIIQGYISKQLHKPSKKTIFKLVSVTRSIKTGKILLRTNAWIKKENIDWKPATEFTDRPFFAEQDQRNNKARLKELTKSKNNKELVKEATLTAILDSAGKAYNAKQYKVALNLYQQAQKVKPEGILRIYAGLYLSHVRLKNSSAAEKAFKKLVKINLESSDTLNLKILFAVNSTDFSGSDLMKRQFLLWVKNITEYFSNNKECFSVVGHSSNSGSKSFNLKLSLKRAQSIKDRAIPYYSNNTNKIRTLGKGFTKNIIGTGADDETDAVDRRVEFSKGC